METGRGIAGEQILSKSFGATCGSGLQGPSHDLATILSNRRGSRTGSLRPSSPDDSEFWRSMYVELLGYKTVRWLPTVLLVCGPASSRNSANLPQVFTTQYTISSEFRLRKPVERPGIPFRQTDCRRFRCLFLSLLVC